MTPRFSMLQNTKLTEILGGTLKQFPQDFSEGYATEGTQLKLPDADLYLEQTNAGGYIPKTDEGDYVRVRNPTEANFIIYAQMRGHQNISVPKEMICLFKIVRATKITSAAYRPG